jgi:hypothetical protein
MFWRSRQSGEFSARRIHTIVPILLFLASASTFAEPREPFVIAIEGGRGLRNGTWIPIEQEAGHSAELHLYSTGGHGFGMLAQGLPSDRWIETFHAWLVALD